MKKFKHIIILCFILTYSTINAQKKSEIKESNNAIVYIGALEKNPTVVQYFNNEKLIGYCERKQYLKFECKPGKQLFWGKFFSINEKSSRVTGFIELDVKPNEVYYIDTKSFTTDDKNLMGSFKKGRNNLVMQLSAINDESSLNQFKELVNRKKPTKISDRKLKKYNEEFYLEITSSLYEYYKKNNKICD